MSAVLLPTEAELRDRYVLLDQALLGEEPTEDPTAGADVRELRGAA